METIRKESWAIQELWRNSIYKTTHAWVSLTVMERTERAKQHITTFQSHYVIKFMLNLK